LRQTSYVVGLLACHEMICGETAGRIEVALGMGLGLGQCSMLPKWGPNTCVHSGETVHHWYGSWPYEVPIVARLLAVLKQYWCGRWPRQ